jgi:ATP adenylyltransferase
MKALWAPWRLEYIKAMSDDTCFLCTGAADARDRENLILKRGEHAIVVMNRYPYNNGHLLVAPIRHLRHLKELTDPERLEIARLIEACIEALGDAVHPHGFNIGLNLGRVAGAGLESHLHYHVVPRWEGDTNFMPVLGEVKVVPQALDDLYAELRRRLEDLAP